VAVTPETPVAASGVLSDKLIAFEVADGSVEGVSVYVQHLP